MFSTRQRVPKVLLPPPKKIDFWPKNGQILPKNWHFWPNMGVFGPFDPMPDQKRMRTRCVGLFFCNILTVSKTFTSTQNNKDFWPKKGHIWPQIDILGKILAFLAYFVCAVTMLDIQQQAERICPILLSSAFELLKNRLNSILALSSLDDANKHCKLEFLNLNLPQITRVN